MHVPRTQVKKRGTEWSIPCMLEYNSWISTKGQVIRMSHNDSHPRLWMTSGRSVSVKSARMTWHSEWMPCLEKFSENALWASSSRNRREIGAKSKDEKAPEWRGFQVGVDLRLGAIDTTNVNIKRGREKETIKKALKQFKYSKYIEMEYVCMGNAWTCDMQSKLHHGLSPIQSYQHTISLHTSKCMRILL